MAPLPYPPAPAKSLLDFIAIPESGGDYGVVYAHRQGKLPKPLTSMTINEVIADGPRRSNDHSGGVEGSSAAGRYQFMQKTLAGLKASTGLSSGELMSPDMQDRLGYQLLLQRGYKAFMAGSISLVEFAKRIAMEWASFPVLATTVTNRKKGNGLITVRRGQSYYAGDGQNHALVDPVKVEKVLSAMRGAPAVAVAEPVAPAPVIVAPRVETVTATPAAASWLERWFSPKKVTTKARPGLHPNGDPALWDVQAGMKDRGYYNTGLLDGLDGRKTQAAVAQIRKDNDLGDGGIDAEFMAAFPNFPSAAVSAERRNAGLMKARASDPAAFNPAIWLATTGLSTLGLGGASAGGAFDQITSAVDKFNGVAGQVQGGLSTVSNVVMFLVEHKTLVLFGVGAFFTVRGLAWCARLWVDYRLGRR